MIELKPPQTELSLDVNTILQAARILKTIGHPQRLRIVECLEDYERSVKELQSDLDLPQAIVSQQLAILKRRGVVNSRREGVSVYYRLADSFPCRILECIRSCRGEIS